MKAENKLYLILIFFILVIAIGSYQYDKITKQKDIKNKSAYFKQNKELICSKSTFSDSYLVSQKNGWYLLGDNVTNGKITYTLPECHLAKKD